VHWHSEEGCLKGLPRSVSATATYAHNFSLMHSYSPPLLSSLSYLLSIPSCLSIPFSRVLAFSLSHTRTHTHIHTQKHAHMRMHTHAHTANTIYTTHINTVFRGRVVLSNIPFASSLPLFLARAFFLSDRQTHATRTHFAIYVHTHTHTNAALMMASLACFFKCSCPSLHPAVISVLVQSDTPFDDRANAHACYAIPLWNCL